jgi:hypothetical protein
MATTTGITPGTQSSASYNSLPDWYTQYGQALTGQGLGLMGNLQNYNGYSDAAGNPAPRVAGLSAAQGQAVGQVENAQGAWQPYMGQANAIQNNANSTIGSQLGNVAQMTGGLGTATGMLNPAQSMVGQGAQGYQSGDANPYMNDYTNNVVNRIAELGNRNLTENVLPQVNSTFTGAGQFGSTRNADFDNRALRDNQDAISGAQATALMQSQNNAMSAWQADQQRMLQGGQAQGQLAATQGNIASGYGNAAQVGGQLGSAMSNVGNNLANLGSTVQSSNINDANALLTVGGLQQNTDQKALDASYQDFLDRRDYPVQTLGALSQVLPNASGKITPNTQSTTVAQGPQADSMTNWTNLINLINAG